MRTSRPGRPCEPSTGASIALGGDAPGVEGRGRVEARERDGARGSEGQAARGGRPSRHQSLTGLGVCTVARPRHRGSWPRPGPLPSSSQPPSEDARSTCSRPSRAQLQRQGHEPSSRGRWPLGGRIIRDLPRKPPSCPGKACLLLGRLRSWPAVLSSLLTLATLLPGPSWRGPPERLSLHTARPVHLVRTGAPRWRGRLPAGARARSLGGNDTSFLG